MTNIVGIGWQESYEGVAQKLKALIKKTKKTIGDVGYINIVLNEVLMSGTTVTVLNDTCFVKKYYVYTGQEAYAIEFDGSQVTIGDSMVFTAKWYVGLKLRDLRRELDRKVANQGKSRV